MSHPTVEHDRSLAPERQWNRAYRELLQYLDASGPWFTTASDAVEWYRWRRSVTFIREQDGSIRVTSASLRAGLPGARIAIHRTKPGLADQLELQGSDALSVSL